MAIEKKNENPEKNHLENGKKSQELNTYEKSELNQRAQKLDSGQNRGRQDVALSRTITESKKEHPNLSQREQRGAKLDAGTNRNRLSEISKKDMRSDLKTTPEPKKEEDFSPSWAENISSIS